MVTIPGCSPYQIDPAELKKLYEEIKLQGYLSLDCLSQTNNADRQTTSYTPYALRSNLTTTTTSTTTINNFSDTSHYSSPYAIRKIIPESLSPESNKFVGILTPKRPRDNVYDFGDNDTIEQHKELQHYKRQKISSTPLVKGSMKSVIESLSKDNNNDILASNTNSQVISPRRHQDNSSLRTILTTEVEGRVSLDFSLDSPSERDECSNKIDKLTSELADDEF